jgi:hypothetical protein
VEPVAAGRGGDLHGAQSLDEKPPNEALRPLGSLSQGITDLADDGLPDF